MRGKVSTPCALIFYAETAAVISGFYFISVTGRMRFLAAIICGVESLAFGDLTFCFAKRRNTALIDDGIILPKEESRLWSIMKSFCS